jgi:cytoskeletal protein CcmA (bactofilin family)
MGSANEQLDPKGEKIAPKGEQRTPPKGEQLAPKGGTYIGLGTVFKGEISVPELLVVEGTVEGDVKTHTLRVGPNGAIKGKVLANNADIHGTLSEDAEIADFLLVRSTGRIEGHVKCCDVQVERGAAIKGDLWTGVGKSAASQAEVNVNNIEPFPPATRQKVKAAE